MQKKKGKFKIGDIVRIKEDAFADQQDDMDEYRRKYSGGLGEIKYYYRHFRNYITEKNNVGDYILDDDTIEIYFSDCDLELVTEKQDRFLYHILGFDALRTYQKGVKMDKNIFNRNKNETRQAYADCWMKDFSKAEKIRNLDWSGDQMDLDSAHKIMRSAVMGYNSYDTDHVFSTIKELNLKTVVCSLAREGSVALYFSGDDVELRKIMKLEKKLNCDECDLRGCTLRLWWD